MIEEFPISIRVNAKTISSEVVMVKPMDAPSVVNFWFDTYTGVVKDKTEERKAKKLEDFYDKNYED